MTQASKDLIDILEAEVSLAEDRIATAKESFERGLWIGRRDATKEALAYVNRALPEVEAEAVLVPEQEEPFASVRERVAA